MIRIIKTSILLSMIFSIVSFSYAQERIKIKKNEFKQTEEGFSTAWKSIKHANFLFKQYREGSYRKAIPLYLDALQYNTENPELNLLLGICYLRSWPKEKAITYIQKATDLKSDVHPKSQFFLGRAYQCAGDFNKALIAYNDYKDRLSPKDNLRLGKIIEKYIGECESGLLLKKKPVRALIDNMGQNINTEFHEYSAGFSADGLFMAFTSKRPGMGGLKSQLDNNYYEDIYFSKKVGDKWEVAENADAQVNSKWNDAFVSLSDDGQKMIVYKGHKKEGNLYSLTKDLSEWGYLQSVSKKVNKRKSYESFLCFNGISTKMYFISDRKDASIGGRDIFYCTLDEKGKKWSDPVNLGPNINTEYDEVSVFVTPDESALYFASNGHNTIGGYDIFKSVNKNGEWSEAVNMGMPINTPTNEVFFRLMSNGRDAYYASDNQSGLGDFDLYAVTLLCPEKPNALGKDDELLAGLKDPKFEPIIEKEVQLSYTRMTVVKGIVTDYNTGKPLDALVELVDNKTGNKEKDTHSSAENGSYMITLPSGKNYGFSVNADGYMFHSENFNVPAASGYKEIFKDIQLQPMTAGSKIILFNTFFETGKAMLSPESYSELNRLAAMFTKYPNLVIEISGHTDSRGNKASNQKLSNARAKSVVDYLLSQGVKPYNLKAVGYYFLYPVASNKTEAGRQQNRRVEAKILSN
jgi:outer membrane protein OmpA-like peptidoglycan-associated protein/tetratricopeptide (TPR) repeat protein